MRTTTLKTAIKDMKVGENKQVNIATGKKYDSWLFVEKLGVKQFIIELHAQPKENNDDYYDTFQAIFDYCQIDILNDLFLIIKE